VRAWLDSWLYRHPFEGASARRYASAERPAFGALDDRLLDAWAPKLATARRLLDLGCGPRTFALRAAARWPDLEVIGVDPSRDLACHERTVRIVRAAGEALPFAARAVDHAICLSSIRHVRDRLGTLRELRRVVAGELIIVELDPEADGQRIAAHARRLGSAVLRYAFGPLVARTAPPAQHIVQLARTAGWQVRARRDDAEQPVYILELA